jgi:hypothetical protein
MKIIPFLFYPYLLGICVVVSILMTREKHK